MATGLTSGRFKLLGTMIIVHLTVFAPGCASFRSDIEGTFKTAPVKNVGAEKVNVLFLFSHLEQTHGYDVIPKYKSYTFPGFDDIFRDALSEISNIKEYATATELPDDVNFPNRRASRDSLRTAHDFTIHITFLQEKSFAKHFLSGLFSTITLTTFPFAYTTEYSVRVDVSDSHGTLLQTFQRSAELTQWVHTALILVYPFHPEQRKKEEIYVAFLRDVFRQIESEKTLKSIYALCLGHLVNIHTG